MMAKLLLILSASLEKLLLSDGSISLISCGLLNEEHFLPTT